MEKSYSLRDDKGKPMQWAFDLVDAYEKLKLSDLDALAQLDEKALATAKAVVAYVTDKTVGIGDVKPTDIEHLKSRIGTNDATPEKISIEKAQGLYNQIHPVSIQASKLLDMPDDMSRELFRQVGIRDVIHVAETSKASAPIVYKTEGKRILLQEAEELALMIESSISHRFEILTLVAKLRFLTGDKEGAKALFEKLTAMAMQLHDESDKQVALWYIGSSQAEMGLILEAKETINLMTHAHVSHYESKIYRDIARSFARAGDYKSAIETVELMETLKIRHVDRIANNIDEDIVDALKDIALVQGSRGLMGEAIETINYIEEVYDQCLGLAGIARLQMKQGNKEGAKETFEVLIARVQTRDPDRGQIQFLYETAVDLAKIGYVGRANEIAENMIDRDKEETLAGIAKAQSEGIQTLEIKETNQTLQNLKKHYFQMEGREEQLLISLETSARSFLHSLALGESVIEIKTRIENFESEDKILNLLALATII